VQELAEVQKPEAAFVLSLIGGIFILLAGGAMTMFGSWVGNYGYGMMGGYGGFGGMMGYGYPGYRYGYGMMNGLGYGFGLVGILGVIFGIIVIISALMLNRKPEEHSMWGTLIVIFSVLSIFGGTMGGFGIGLILGLIGGILAIAWKPQTQPKT
jgi:hypothetical protein